MSPGSSFCATCSAARRRLLGSIPASARATRYASSSAGPSTPSDTNDAPSPLPRSPIFDIPELGTDRRPLAVRKWRRRQTLQSASMRNDILQARNLRAGGGDDAAGGAVLDQADGEGEGLETRYTRRQALRPADRPAVDLWGGYREFLPLTRDSELVEEECRVCSPY